MDPVSVIDLDVVELQDAIAMPVAIFELAFIAKPIRIEKNSIAIPYPISFLPLVLEL